MSRLPFGGMYWLETSTASDAKVVSTFGIDPMLVSRSSVSFGPEN
jgi:hypothetical protein